jgi:hypothetical protein
LVLPNEEVASWKGRNGGCMHGKEKRKKRLGTKDGQIECQEKKIAFHPTSPHVLTW